MYNFGIWLLYTAPQLNTIVPNRFHTGLIKQSLIMKSQFRIWSGQPIYLTIYEFKWLSVWYGAINVLRWLTLRYLTSTEVSEVVAFLATYRISNMKRFRLVELDFKVHGPFANLITGMLSLRPWTELYLLTFCSVFSGCAVERFFCQRKHQQWRLSREATQVHFTVVLQPGLHRNLSKPLRIPPRFFLPNDSRSW